MEHVLPQPRTQYLRWSRWSSETVRRLILLLLLIYSAVKSAEADFNHMYNVSDIIECMGRIKRTTATTLTYAEIQAQDDGQNVSAVGGAFVKKYYHFVYVRAGVINCKVKKCDPTYTTHTMKKTAGVSFIISLLSVLIFSVQRCLWRLRQWRR